MSDKIPFLQTFRSIRITNTEGKEFNITSAVAELSIFEDLFSNVLTGEVVIGDSQGILDNINIQGNEKLTVELSKDGSVSIHDFLVYSVSDRIKNNMTSEVYKLQFMSVENVISENTRVYSAFNGTNDVSVSNIFASYIASKKPFEVEKTIGSFKYVMPSWTPFEAINWYAGRSISAESKGSYFLFHETMNGFRFKSVETMVKQESKMDYHYEPVASTMSAKDISNIREYQVVSMNDTISGTAENNTTLWTDDLIRKKIVKVRYDADSSKDSLNKEKLMQFDKTGFGLSLKERRDVFGSEVILKPETRQIHTQTKNYRYSGVQEKLAAMRRFATLKLRFLAFGCRHYNVGDCINLNILQTKAVTSNNKDSAKDKQLSGKYLVTAIHYIFKPQDFHMSVEVVKDSKDLT